MKKVLSLLIVISLLLTSVISVTAAEPQTELKGAVFEKYVYWCWESYVEMLKELNEKNEEEHPELIKPIPEFDEYLAAFTPAPKDFYAFDYYGIYGENDISFWRINGAHAPLVDRRIISNYVINTSCVTEENFYAFIDGELINLFEAYDQGLVTDEDLTALNNSHLADDVMQRIGDMNNDKVFTVSDILEMKSLILSGEIYHPEKADLDGNGSVTVSDILALKQLIIGG